MPDWSAFVKKRLQLSELRPERVAEICEEVARQLEDIEQAALAAGCTPAEAERLCREHIPDWVDFSRQLIREDRTGKLDRVRRWQERREAARISEGKSMGSDFGRDIAFALRTISRRPTVALVATLTMGLAIAAATSIFSVVNGVLLTELPYAEPERLVTIWERHFPRNRMSNPVSPANFLDWRDEATVFSSMGILAEFSGTLTGGHDPERIGVMIVSASLFPTLGMQPAAGRLFRPEDDVAGAAPTAVLSHGFWQRRYGGDEGLIGKSIVVDGTPREVIGVLPAGFEFRVRWVFDGAGSQDIWVTPRWGDNARSATGRWLQVVGRLNDGESVASAQAAMDALAEQLKERRPEDQAGWGIRVLPLFDEVVGETRPALLVLLGAVLFVLLIACANVANLMLSRVQTRRREMSVRAALGAGRLRLIRQLLTESVLIAAAAGALGILLSFWILRVLLSMAPDSIPRLDNVTLDWGVLLFAVGISLLTGVLFGLAPALKATRVSLGVTLKDGAGRGGTARGSGRYVLVIAEVALCLVLLVGAGLLIRTFQGLVDAGVGFDTSRLLTFTIELEGRTAAERADFFDELVTRIEALPGVVSAGAGTFVPLLGNGSATSFWVNDRPRPSNAEVPTADVRWVDSKLLQTLGVPLLEGRFFETTDSAEDGLKVVVSRALAERFWPGQSALGKTLTMPWGEDRIGEVVGVVGDVRHQGMESAPRSKIYWYHRQFHDFGFMSIVARTSGEPTALLPVMRRVVLEMDDQLALYKVGTMAEYFAAVVAPARFSMTLLSLFALVALALAAAGIYGVMSCAVSERNREMGIRLALGAARAQVRWMVLRRGALAIAVALVLGAAGALALSRFVESMLFEIVRPEDPLTFSAVALLLAGVGLIACYLPAHRASQVDPLQTLRYD